MPEPHSRLTTVPSNTADSTGTIYLNSLEAEVRKISAESTRAPHFIPATVLPTLKEARKFPRQYFEKSMSEISDQSDTLEPHFIPTMRSSLTEEEGTDCNGSTNQDPLEAAISTACATSKL